MRRDVFQAIADPTRREILGMVSHKPMNINEVSDHFAVTRAAVYKHVKMLKECGLVVVKQQGRERFCEARLEKLSEVSEWVAQYSKHWASRLESLDQYLKEIQANESSI